MVSTSLDPSTVEQGTDATVTVAAFGLAPSTEVSYQVSAPAPLTASPGQGTLTVPGGENAKAEVTIGTAQAEPGSYPITVTTVAGRKSVSADYTLTVRAPFALPGSLRDRITDVTVNADPYAGVGLGKENLTDNNPDTGWAAPTDNDGPWAVLTLDDSATVNRYAVTIAAGYAAFYPLTAVTLQGSTDGTDYTTLDTRTDLSFTAADPTQVFTVADPGSYRF